MVEWLDEQRHYDPSIGSLYENHVTTFFLSKLQSNDINHYICCLYDWRLRSYIILFEFMILTYNKTYTMTHTHNNRYCTTFSENIINLNKIFLFDTHKHTITLTNRGAQWYTHNNINTNTHTYKTKSPWYQLKFYYT